MENAGPQQDFLTGWVQGDASSAQWLVLCHGSILLGCHISLNGGQAIQDPIGGCQVCRSCGQMDHKFRWFSKRWDVVWWVSMIARLDQSALGTMALWKNARGFLHSDIAPRTHHAFEVVIHQCEPSDQMWINEGHHHAKGSCKKFINGDIAPKGPTLSFKGIASLSAVGLD